MQGKINRRLADRIQIILFLFFGVTDLWLWYVGYANDFAAVAGIAFLAGVIVLSRHVFRKSA